MAAHLIREWTGIQQFPTATKTKLLDFLGKLKQENVSTLTILVMGKGGVGKSSTVNSIIGERVVAVNALQSEGTRPVMVSRSWAGFTLNIIDTPGLVEGGYVNDQALEIIKRFLLNKTIDILLYVDRLDAYRVDNLDRQIVRAITDSFGKEIWQRGLVVLTHAQLSPPDGLNYEDFSSQRSEALLKVVRLPFSALSLSRILIFLSLKKIKPKMAPDLVTTTTKSTTAGLGKAASLTSQVYVTFLAGNGDYVKGVVGLAKGLRKVKSAYPLVVAILPDVPEEHRRILVAQGCIVREIEPVYPPDNQTQFAMAHYVINYSKLRIWEFVEYHKMIYLDADIQVYDNIDHLFDMPNGYFYAVMDCFCGKPWSHTPQYKIGYCQQSPNKVQWPADLGPQPACYFNAGMFVHEPNLSIYDDLLKTLKITPPTPFAEQDFLNMFFRKMYKPIPLVYNLILPLMWRHPENFELDKVKVVHYCAADPGSKPWRYTGKEANMDREDIKMLVKKWWDIYNDESLDYKRTEISIADSNTDKIMVALAEAGGVNFITSIAAPSAA